MDKSFVTLEQQVCVVCGKEFDTGALLLDKHMRPKFEMHTVTGYGMCPEHEKLRGEGYIAMVECQDPGHGKTHLKQEDALRTGRVMHMRQAAFQHIMNIEPPDKGLCFIDPEAFNKITQMYEDAIGKQEDSDG